MGETWFYRELSWFPNNIQISSIHADTWGDHDKTEIESRIICLLHRTKYRIVTLEDSEAV